MEIRVFILFTLIAVVHSKLIDLSCKQIKAFVDGHNWKRLQVTRGKISNQPPATVMNFMMWDDELAAKAAKWASRDQFQHNPDKTIGTSRFRTGENLYWYGTTDLDYKLDPNMALDSWFEEHKDFTYRPLRRSDFDAPDKQIGHYTQMVWSNTMYVGCAISQRVENNWKYFLVVCNYGPGGNFLKQVPYKSSDVGSKYLTCANPSGCRRPYGDKCNIS